jgi:hydrogenase maturation protease
MKKTAIIGLGNLFREDDGVGILLLQKLKQNKNLIPENIDFIEAGIPGMNLIHMIEPYDQIIFIDAVNFNQKPSSSFFFKPENVTSQKNNKNPVSIHETDVLKIIEIYKKIKPTKKQFYIFGVQPKNTDYGETISEDIKKNFEKIFNKLTEEINNLNKK